MGAPNRGSYALTSSLVVAALALVGCEHPAPERQDRNPEAPAEGVQDRNADPPTAVHEYATGGASTMASPSDAASATVASDAGTADARGRIVVTTSDECGLVIDQIYFDTSSSAIKPTSKPILDATAEMFRCWYRTKEVLRWEVDGHTDGTEKDAIALSDARAAAVKQALVTRGVLASTLEPKGYGATQPLDRRGTEAARAKNRRVSFLVLDRGKP